MSYQTIFKRYEMKYMLTKEQKEDVLLAMVPYMKIDKYGRTTIRNIYFDTDSYRLIRHSIEKPVYKEKLRIRSYKQTKAEDTVFIELKKKYDSVVYKRRIALPQAQVMDFINKGEHLHQRSQISATITVLFILPYFFLMSVRHIIHWIKVIFVLHLMIIFFAEPKNFL